MLQPEGWRVVSLAIDIELFDTLCESVFGYRPSRNPDFKFRKVAPNDLKVVPFTSYRAPERAGYATDCGV